MRCSRIKSSRLPSRAPHQTRSTPLRWRGRSDSTLPVPAAILPPWLPSLRNGLQPQIKPRPKPAPISDGVIERPGEHDQIDDAQPGVDATVASLETVTAVLFNLLIMGSVMRRAACAVCLVTHRPAPPRGKLCT